MQSFGALGPQGQVASVYLIDCKCCDETKVGRLQRTAPKCFVFFHLSISAHEGSFSSNVFMKILFRNFQSSSLAPPLPRPISSLPYCFKAPIIICTSALIVQTFGGASWFFAEYFQKIIYFFFPSVCFSHFSPPFKLALYSMAQER